MFSINSGIFHQEVRLFIKSDIFHQKWAFPSKMRFSSKVSFFKFSMMIFGSLSAFNGFRSRTGSTGYWSQSQIGWDIVKTFFGIGRHSIAKRWKFEYISSHQFDFRKLVIDMVLKNWVSGSAIGKLNKKFFF